MSAFSHLVYEMDPCHYAIPRQEGWQVDVHAFLTENLLEGTFIPDDRLWDQVAKVATLEDLLGLCLMPDTHVGYYLPIGGVAVTSEVLLPTAAGYDINCGVLYLRVPGLHVSKLRKMKRRLRWIHEVEKRIPTGVGSHRPDLMREYTQDEIQDVLINGAMALGAPVGCLERPNLPVPEDLPVHKIQKAWSKARPQLGSLGGGNHFIELQADPKDGSVWIMIHSGSRGFGWQIANHFFRLGAQTLGLAKGHKEEVLLHRDSELGQDYWHHHNAAANYAAANRYAMAQAVIEATFEVFGVEAEPYYDISHNLIQEEPLLDIMGKDTGKTGLVHRKGSTRALPAGHPLMVGTKWETTGHPCLIPGSMYDGAAILFAEPGATKSFCTVNHGAGRSSKFHGRKDAKRKLAHHQERINQEMVDITRVFDGVEIVGIATNNKDIPLDESREAYKSLDEVLRALREADIARVERRMFPVANVKSLS